MRQLAKLWRGFGASALVMDKTNKMKYMNLSLKFL